MTLADYLQAHGLTAAEFARRIGRSRSTVARWCTGQRHPDAAAMRAIMEETGGAVMPNDFFSTAI
ncbi:helix-turn-helix domain-containing protein [Nitrospirillum amazonense]|uniref:Helix-turn-helix protein n=1 Tax=Nitrospirillum amazonense TaxID=28077 RepID=A0A560JKA8_9PROT|nr:helix-turn-helix transcriptional regulator [Nitrospirillum amazonense]MDG3439377.1 helix-turn-helix transcriptional regulator [Nitrospirillum amazonense]TWB69834.1 helix-turn-helix protein [Nitrospirillum amazonense]